jgi:hypothetical protein
MAVGVAKPARARDGGGAPGGDEAAGDADSEHLMHATAARKQQWAAFASGVAAQLGEEEQAERCRRRQWAAAAAQSERDRSLQLAELSGEVERWAAREHRRLQPLQTVVWRALRAVASEAQALWPAASVELFGSWASGLQLASSDVECARAHTHTTRGPFACAARRSAHAPRSVPVSTV